MCAQTLDFDTYVQYQILKRITCKILNQKQNITQNVWDTLISGFFLEIQVILFQRMSFECHLTKSTKGQKFTFYLLSEFFIT